MGWKSAILGQNIISNFFKFLKKSRNIVFFVLGNAEICEETEVDEQNFQCSFLCSLPLSFLLGVDAGFFYQFVGGKWAKFLFTHVQKR